MKENPQNLYDKICTFLEIEPVENPIVNSVINKGSDEQIPKIYEQMLVDKLYPYIKKFAKNHPNKYSLAWVEKYRKYEN